MFCPLWLCRPCPIGDAKSKQPIRKENLSSFPAAMLCGWMGQLQKSFILSGMWPPKRKQNASRSEEHTSELQSLMRISYAVFCLKKKNKKHIISTDNT